MGRLPRSRLRHTHGMADRAARWKPVRLEIKEHAVLAPSDRSFPRRWAAGFLQGLLFAGIITLLEPINADERSRTIILTLIIIVIGIFAGAGLSFVTAYLNERRRNRAVA